MTALLGLALKSLLVTTIALALLRMMRRRSAAERSLIAHLGLLALVVLPVAGLALPSLDLPVPAIAARVVAAAPPVATAREAVATSAPISDATVAPGTASIDWTRYAYAAPVVALLLLTLLALLRLLLLSRRAEVLVEPTWLSALAHAQRRMGLKSGTALLVSDALPSPVSWGWARPVILLNRVALDATGEAEAIIAHELAHVASLDWAKLMLARVATALFWFNPLAWLLAREAHQLREEAADDAVLATAIAAPDYAQLLVGVARHEAKGLLLGAHGVAPGRSSLRRRVGRVLDTTLARRPAGGAWIAGFGTGMLVMAAPLAALTLAPRVQEDRDATVRPIAAPPRSEEGARATAAQRDDGDAAPIASADPETAPGVRIARRSRPSRTDHSAVDDAIAMKATGVTPGYVAALAAAAPWPGGLSADDAVAMRAVGVTPGYVRDLAAAGLAPLRRDDVIGASAVGVTGAYARAMAAAGYRGGLARLIELRAVGLSPGDLARRHGADERRDAPD